MSFRAQNASVKLLRVVQPQSLTGREASVLRKWWQGLRTPPRDGHFQMWFKDGAADGFTPNQFGLYVSVSSAKTIDVAPLGFITVGFPLEDLADWVERGDQLVTALQATSATLGPGLFSYVNGLFSNRDLADQPDERVSRLYATDPQLDDPGPLAIGPFRCNEVRPSWFDGLFAPSWVMWFTKRLAKHVNADFEGERVELPKHSRFRLGEDVPFEMTEARYAAWRQAWQAMRGLHLWVTNETPNAYERWFSHRFDFETLGALRAEWRERVERETAARLREQAVRKALFELVARRRSASADDRAKANAEFLLAAQQAQAVLQPTELLAVVLPAFFELAQEGALDGTVGALWLDFAEQHLGDSAFHAHRFVNAAAVALALGQPARSIALLALARGLDAKALAKDARFKALRQDRRFVKLVAASARA